jgi:hypothetical protein
MAQVRITELPELAVVPDDAQISIVQGGDNYRTTKAALHGSLATIGKLTTAHSPLGLWHFDGALTDSSGHENAGSHTLAVDTGTAVYGDLWPGYRGLSLQSLLLSNSHADFRITGNITIEMVLMFDVAPDGAVPVSWTTIGGSDSDEANNTLYNINVPSTRIPGWFHEDTAGANNSFSPSAVALPPPGVPFHFAATRISNVVRMYVNGVLRGTSGALNGAVGGGNGKLFVGGVTGTLHPNFLLGDLKITGSGLDDSQVAAEAALSVGQLYG